MSIIITNVGGNPLGVSEYEVRINNKIITTFMHNRKDGLPKCLQEAAKAVDKQQWTDSMAIINKTDDDILIQWICLECGTKYGNHKCEVATWHLGECGICKEATSVTEQRDFSYLRKGWRHEKRN